MIPKSRQLATAVQLQPVQSGPVSSLFAVLWTGLLNSNHCLHISRELEASVLEILEVAQHFCNCRSGMRASRDGSREEVTELRVGRANAGGAIVLFEVVPDLFDHHEISDGGLNGRRDAQSDITECLLIVLIPGVKLISGTRGTENEPLVLGPKVGLHGGMPLLPVGASEDGDHLVKSTGHGSKSCCVVNKVSK